MKPAITILAILFLGLSVHGQHDHSGPNILWDQPDIKSQVIKRLGIKAMKVHAYKAPLTRGNGVNEQEHFFFNDKGKLTKSIELVQQDTNSVHTYHYNKKGVLGWKHTQDKKWNRIYREGYRFNSAENVYQVKAYEMLRNRERMLLDTRQYIYNNDSTLIAIRSMENNKLVAVHKFEYNKKGQVKKEIFEDGSNKVLQSVSYGYDAEGRIARVVMDKGMISEYLYEYNSQGQPLQIQMAENGKVKGLVVYQYNTNGLVAQLDKIINPDTSEENHFVKVFQYKK
ncbi:MAG: hypothetical protein AAFY71_19075 [Bacteroidota bacterium]